MSHLIPITQKEFEFSKNGCERKLYNKIVNPLILNILSDLIPNLKKKKGEVWL
jgi:hypothetical protein